MKFLLVAMANYCDEEGVCYPSVRRLAEDTEQDRKTILQNISRLEKIKLVADTGERCGSTKSVPIYRLQISSPENGTCPENGTAKQSRFSQAVPKTAPLSSPVFPTSSPVFPRKQSQKRDTDPSGTVSDPKEEERESTAATGRLHGIPATPVEVIAYGKTLNPPKSEATCIEFFNHYEAQKRQNPNGQVFWITSGERVITDWRAKLAGFGNNQQHSSRGKRADGFNPTTDSHAGRPWKR